MTDEEIRLNQVGAEIMQYIIGNADKEYPLWCKRTGEIVIEQYKWSPATDLNHNAMVMDTFDSWEVYKMGGYGRQKRIYTCKIWETITPIIGQADTEALARARAYEKVWKVEKKEK